MNNELNIESENAPKYIYSIMNTYDLMTDEQINEEFEKSLLV